MFTDRRDAGRRLTRRLEHLRGPDTVVLGLPRGGVPVAAEVAEGLHAPLDVVVVRKLGVPVRPELAMGAVGEGGVIVVNDDVVAFAGVDPAELEAVAKRERAEVEHRSRTLRRARPSVPLAGRTAVVVDDGLATGATARAACAVVRALGAARVVLAAPVGPEGCTEELRDAADEVVCLACPARLGAISRHYVDFSPTSDEEVVALLEQAARADPPGVADEAVQVGGGALALPGRLTVPSGAGQLVLFAHGSGSSRLSPRNRYVADRLQRAGLGTLLFDLLTPEEAADRATVFNVDLLADRLLAGTAWAARHPLSAGLSTCWFGASTGAGAALCAAASPDATVQAIVSRGGRPDLAGARLAQVRAPTLLIVGGNDRAVLELNRQAQEQLHCESRLAVVPGAGHLFVEPGTLDAVADLAADWFTVHRSEVGAAS